MKTTPDLYRPDIDGLRAIAVTSVVIYHAFPNLLPGGFVGVDIFFVISGFLISRIIFGNLESNSFSFRDFYSRRIRRIFPALLLVLIATISIGWIALLPGEFEQLGKHVIAGATFVSNFVLQRESGYFDNAASTKPLLHLWSLGIEEQFYIFWPLIISLAWKRRINFLGLAACVALASFTVNIITTHRDVTHAFYSPFSRFWELMMGGSLAYAVAHYPRLPTNRRDVIALLGAALLATVIFFVNKTDAFPGWLALLPTTGAAFLIAAGPNSWINQHVLGNRIFVFIGLISYPLYLWHWPLLSFLRIVEGSEPPVNLVIETVAIAVLLAWLTFVIIEKPIRVHQKGRLKTMLLCIALAATGITGATILEKDGIPSRMNDREAFVQNFENTPPRSKFYIEHDYPKWYRADCDFFQLDAYRRGARTSEPRSEIAKSCYIKNPSKKFNVLLWGDSHVQQFYYGLYKELPKDWGILIGASSGCNPRVVSENSAIDYCIRSNWVALQTVIREKPDVVIVAQRADHKFEDLRLIDQRLKEAGVPRVIFAGPAPEWDSDLPKIIARDWWLHTPQRTFEHVNKEILALDSRLKKQFKSLASAQYLDLTDFFCNAEGCMTYIGNSRTDGIVTVDYGHLTLAASDYLAKNLLVSAITKPLD